MFAETEWLYLRMHLIVSSVERHSWLISYSWLLKLSIARCFSWLFLNASKSFYLHGSHTFEWVLGCYAKPMTSDWGLWTACPHFNGNSTLLWLKQQFTPKLVYGVEALLRAKRRFQCVHQLLTFPGLNLICSHYTISDVTSPIPPLECFSFYGCCLFPFLITEINISFPSLLMWKCLTHLLTDIQKVGSRVTMSDGWSDCKSFSLISVALILFHLWHGL